jgi:predicted DNA-binding transcriptional regulator YafY
MNMGDKNKKTASGSHRGDLISRMNRIVPLLKEKWRSREELAEQLDVSTRTIGRYIDELSLCSFYYLREKREGHRILYKIEEGSKFIPPELTESDLIALLLAEEVIGEAGLTMIPQPFAVNFDSLMVKLRSAISEEQRKRLSKLKSVLGSAVSPAKDFRKDRVKIGKLLKAALDCRRVRMRYHSLSSNQTTERIFEPYSIYYDPDGATIKVIGFDHKRKDIIPFSIDHILEVRLMKEKFERPSGFSLREFLAENCFNGIHGKPVRVRLRARGVTARIFAERKFHRTQKIIEENFLNSSKANKPDEPEEITVEMCVADGRGLLRFILSWGNEVEVLEPPNIRQQVKETYERALALYSWGEIRAEICPSLVDKTS